MKIKLENLKKTYTSKEGKAITAVANISLDIPENKIFGIIGKSGAGKSSLVRLVSLLETPDEGKVFYGENRVDNLSKKRSYCSASKNRNDFPELQSFYFKNSRKKHRLSS